MPLIAARVAERLTAAGRAEEALLLLQGADPRHLRDYLKRLPDFEDVAAEERALDLVAKRHDREEALWFLLHWPEPHRAARLVLEAARPLNGDLYLLLSPLAELLEKPHLLAATVCLRAMIDFSLEVSRVKRYRHAADHLATCFWSKVPKEIVAGTE